MSIHFAEHCVESDLHGITQTEYDKVIESEGER